MNSGSRLVWQPYGVALAAVALATLSTALLAPLVGRPFLGFYYVAVLVSAWLGGLGPSLLATGLATFVTAYSLSSPIGSLALNIEDATYIGTFVLVALFISVLTEARRRSEKALRDTEERFHLAVESSPSAMLMVNQVGEIVLVNAQVEHLFGYRREELIGQPVEVLLPERFRDGHSLFRAGFFDNPQARRMGVGRDLFGRRKDGAEFPVEVGLNPIQTQSGALVLSAIVDITERKQAERQLQAQAERLRMLAEVWRRFIQAGPNYQAVLDTVARTLSERIGDMCAIRLLSEDGEWLPAAALYHPDPDVAALMREMLQTPQRADEGISGRVVQTGEPVLVPETDNEQVWASTSPKYGPDLARMKIYSLLIVPLRGQGQVMGIVALSRDKPGNPYTAEDQTLLQDLADRAVLAIENARLYAEAQQLNAELERRVSERTAQLETANRQLESFSYSVSHDLRAPLRAISGFAQIVARRHRAELNEEGQHYLDNIVDASARMGRLIEDLLVYARLGSRGVRLRPTALAQVLAEVRNDLGARLDSAELLVAEELPVVQGNSTLLRQIFTNLLDNAITYRRKEAPLQVRVEAHWEGDFTVVCVADNGIGISPEYHEKIFNIFQRLHRDEEYRGTGVGLATVKKSAELLGGQVWVESTVGQGSRFCVKLPLARADSPSPSWEARTGPLSHQE